MSGHFLINEVRLGWHHRNHYGDEDSKKGQNQALDTGRGPRGRVGHELGRKSENGCWSKGRAKITSPVWASIHPVWRRCSSFPYRGVCAVLAPCQTDVSAPKQGMLKKAASGVLAILPCSRTPCTLRASKGLRPCWTDPSERLRACFF